MAIVDHRTQIINGETAYLRHKGIVPQWLSQHESEQGLGIWLDVWDLRQAWPQLSLLMKGCQDRKLTKAVGRFRAGLLDARAGDVFPPPTAGATTPTVLFGLPDHPVACRLPRTEHYLREIFAAGYAVAWHGSRQRGGACIIRLHGDDDPFLQLLK